MVLYMLGTESKINVSVFPLEGKFGEFVMCFGDVKRRNFCKPAAARDAKNPFLMGAHRRPPKGIIHPRPKNALLGTHPLCILSIPPPFAAASKETFWGGGECIVGGRGFAKTVFGVIKGEV